MSSTAIIVRSLTGQIFEGNLDGATPVWSVAPGQAISLNLAPADVAGYARDGGNLVITLTDGRVIVLDGAYVGEAMQADLYLSAAGQLLRVTPEVAQGPVQVSYEMADGLGKWASNDALYHVGEPEPALASYGDDAPEAGMLASGLLAGIGAVTGGGLGTAAAVGAGIVGGGALIGGGRDNQTDAAGLEITGGTSATGKVINQDSLNDAHVVTGRGAPGAEVAVTIGDDQATVVVGDDGAWSVPVPGPLTPGTYDVPVVAKSKGQTASDQLDVDTELSVGFDGVGGDGVINGAEQAGAVRLTGTVDQGASVTVTVNGADHAAVVTGGSWHLDLPQGSLPGGTYDLPVLVRATDAAGNRAEAAGQVQVDTQITLEVDPLALATSADGGQVFAQGTAEPGAVVSVVGGGQATAGADGRWQIAVQVPSGDGTLPLTVRASDAAGNATEVQAQLAYDTHVDPLTHDGVPTGGDGVLNATETDQDVVLAGRVEAGSTVAVTLDGVAAQVTVAPDGDWQAVWPAGSFAAGERPAQLVVTAVDANGNRAELTETLVIDTHPGDLTLSDAPVAGDDIVNAAEVADGVQITGTATPGMTVTVGLAGLTATAVAADDGVWTANFTGLAPGNYEAQITASITDAAGNSRSVSDRVRVDTAVDGLAITRPITDDDIVSRADADGGFAVSGTVEPGARLVVQLGDATRTVTAGNDGSWSAIFGAEITGTEPVPLVVTARDVAGNSRRIEQTVQVDTAVENLAADVIEGDDKVSMVEALDGVQLSGQVEPGSTVVVSAGGVSHAAVVDGAGQWQAVFAPGELAQGAQTVTVIATDAVGNVAEITRAITVDTTAPDAPHTQLTLDAGSEVMGITVAPSDADLSFAALDDAGQLTPVGVAGTASGGMDFYTFDAPVPDGSALIVTATETSSGNKSSTYFAMQSAGDGTVVLDADALAGLNLTMVDLDVADGADLTLTAADLARLAPAGHQVTVQGGADDTLRLTGATATGETRAADGRMYDVYSLGDDGSVLASTEMTVVI